MIFFKRCPCCNKNIFVWTNSVCKCIENYKCYYCPKCRNQITHAKEVKKENMSLNIFVASLAILVLSSINDKINISSFIFWAILILLIVSMVLTYVYGLFIKLTCIDDSCKEELERDNSDLWGSNMPFMKMDSIEKENYHQQIDFVTGVGEYGLLIFIILGAIISLVKYLIS